MMLRFSRRSKDKPPSPAATAAAQPAAAAAATQQMYENVVNEEEEDIFTTTTTTTPSTRISSSSTTRTSTWLNTLRKRTLSVDSFSNIFGSNGAHNGGGGAARKSSINSNGAGSITSMGGTTKLMRAHKMQTKTGEPVELYFGYDALSVNGRSIAYGEIVQWSHSASHFNFTFLVQHNRRKDVVLCPTANGPKPSEVTEMISLRIARLLADRTGCSEERALRMATSRANEAELKLAADAFGLEEQLNATGRVGGGGGKSSSSSDDALKSRHARTGSSNLPASSSGIIELDINATIRNGVGGDASQ